jgi:hypothetical protein
MSFASSTKITVFADAAGLPHIPTSGVFLFLTLVSFHAWGTSLSSQPHESG